MGIIDRMEGSILSDSSGNAEDEEVIAVAESIYTDELNGRFESLIAATPGMTQEGAARYIEVADKIPKGYTYFGTWPNEATQWRLSVPPPPPDTIVFDHPVFGVDGEPLPDYVYLIKESPKE